MYQLLILKQGEVVHGFVIWLHGSFSSQLAEERSEVVEDLKRAMDLSIEFGCNRITTCPLNEGHDYIFELDYWKAYKYFEETIGSAASYKPEVQICIEYKWNDPRARCLLGNAGETLAFCQNLGLKNVGVTLDFGHSIQAGERPAQSVVLLSQAKKLFYVHLNDNDKFWDWDMIPGAYNFWDFIEFFYYLKQAGYTDWFAYDVFPKEINTVKNFEIVAMITKKLMNIAYSLDSNEIERLLEKRDPSESMKYLYELVFAGR
ncbi:MAG: sugar phosphate isomerase/epimerase family protein [Bacteroidales bacterium]